MPNTEMMTPVASAVTLDISGWDQGWKEVEKTLQNSTAKVNSMLSNLSKSFQNVTGFAQGFAKQIGGDTLESMGKMAKGGALAGTAVAAVAAGFAYATKEALHHAAQLNDTAASLGITTDALQELNYVAIQGGVTQDGMTKALSNFTKQLGEAKQGGGPLVEFLKDYDRTLLANLQHTKDAASGFNLMADAVEKENDSTKRRALVQAAFGKSELNMVNTLMVGSDAIAQQRQQAEQLGFVISNDLIGAANDADNKLDALGATIKNQFTAELIKLAPEIDNVATKLADGLPTLISWVNNLANLLGGTSNVDKLKDVTEQIDKMTHMGATDRKAGFYLFNQDQYQKDLAGLRQQRDDLVAQIEKDKKTQQAINENNKSAAGADAGSGKGAYVKSEVDAAAAKAKSAAEENQKAIDKLTTKVDAETAAYQRLSTAQDIGVYNYEQMKKQIEAEKEVRESNAKMTDQQTQAIVQQAMANEELKASIQRVEDEMKNLSKFAEQVGQKVSSAFEDAIFSGNSLRETISGLIQDISKMVFENTVGNSISNFISQKVFGGLTGMFGSGGGLTQSIDPYAAISAPQLSTPKFATGGSFMVGGSGGTDSQMVKFKASPNERVTVETPQQQRSSDGGTNVTNHFTIDARGAAPGVEQQIRAAVDQAVALSVKANQEVRRRNPRGTR